MINTSNLEQAKDLIKKSTQKPIIVKAQNEIFNRKILEYGKFDILLDIESTAKKETTSKNIDSGFNHVLAKIASKNNISLGIDLKSIESLNKKERSIILEKIIQNIKICRKAKTKIKLLNFKDKINSFSLLLSLGASTSQAKEAIE